MRQLTFACPDELLFPLGGEPDVASHEIRVAAAVKLYELRRLPTGDAARLAGMPKPLFVSKLGDYGVAAFRLSAEELHEDLQNA